MYTPSHTENQPPFSGRPMSYLDPSIFNEANASQKRAVEMLRSMGWAYVPRAEAEKAIDAADAGG